MAENEHKFYGFYRGKVLDNVDPLKQGRIKIEVYPMLVGVETAARLRREDANLTIEGIETDQLPWAVCAAPLITGAGSGFGWFAVPDVDTFVFVFFEGGDIHQPVYFAEAPTASHGLPTTRETNYPKRRVITTMKGISIVFDDETGHLIITGAGEVIVQTEKGDVIVQGENVRINPT